jgi:hypothetical protein
MTGAHGAPNSDEADPIPGWRPELNLELTGAARVASRLHEEPARPASELPSTLRPDALSEHRTRNGPVIRSAAASGAIAWWLWVLLVGSLVFFAMVRVHVRHEQAKFSRPMEAVPFLQTTSPAGAVRAGAVDLGWSEVPMAAAYRISVTTVTGRIVVDALPVQGTEWTPPDDALPALISGEYRWSVEALDEKGRVLARSAEAAFRVM